MTLPAGELAAPTTTITVTRAIPADLADELRIAAGDRDAGDVLKVEHDAAMRLVREDYARFGSDADAAAASTLGTPYTRKVTVPLDIAAVPAGGLVTQPVPVPRAKVGQVVGVKGPDALDAGLVVGATVTAPGTVTVRVANTTGAAIDPAAGDWTVVLVIR